MSGRPTDATDAVERSVGRWLRAGTSLAVGLLGLGVIALLASGGSPLDPASPLDLERLPADLAALRPEGFLWLGLLAAIATPSLRVVVALVGFARQGERRMAVVAGLTLAVVVGGVGLAIGFGG